MLEALPRGGVVERTCDTNTESAAGIGEIGESVIEKAGNELDDVDDDDVEATGGGGGPVCRFYLHKINEWVSPKKVTQRNKEVERKKTHSTYRSKFQVTKCLPFVVYTRLVVLRRCRVLPRILSAS
jgi:hypothetical protein